MRIAIAALMVIGLAGCRKESVYLDVNPIFDGPAWAYIHTHPCQLDEVMPGSRKWNSTEQRVWVTPDLLGYKCDDLENRIFVWRNAEQDENGGRK